MAVLVPAKKCSILKLSPGTRNCSELDLRRILYFKNTLDFNAPNIFIALVCILQKTVRSILEIFPCQDRKSVSSDLFKG